MATTTTNLGLTKPATSDNVDVTVINRNMDIIDTKIGAVGSTPLQTQVTNVAAGISTSLSGKAEYRKLSNPEISCSSNADITNAIATEIGEMENYTTALIQLNITSSGLNLPGERWAGLLFRGNATYYSCIFQSYVSGVVQYYHDQNGEHWERIATTDPQNAIGIVVDGNKAALSATVGQFIVLRNSTISGCSDGLYTAAKAIPANTAIDSSYLTAVSGGGLNSLLGMPYNAIRVYTNATMAQIVSDIPYGNIGFAANSSVDEAKRPNGITSAFYFAIVPKMSYSQVMFAIVWSNVDAPHVVNM